MVHEASGKVLTPKTTNYELRTTNQWVREPHAKCVKIPRSTPVRTAKNLVFQPFFALALVVLKELRNRIDSVNGFTKVRGLLAKKPNTNQ